MMTIAASQLFSYLNLRPFLAQYIKWVGRLDFLESNPLYGVKVNEHLGDRDIILILNRI